MFITKSPILIPRSANTTEYKIIKGCAKELNKRTKITNIIKSATTKETAVAIRSSAFSAFSHAATYDIPEGNSYVSANV